MKAKYLFMLWAAINCHPLNAAGQTWKQATNYGAICVTMSADGCKLAACTSATPFPLISSTDAGQTWHTNQTPDRGGFLVIYYTADGAKLVANGTYTYQINISTNSGSNWTATTAPTGNYAHTVCTSAHGNILAAASGNGFKGPIYVSTNSGLAWTFNSSLNKSWTSIASSADGTKLVAAASGDQIYDSTNFGATWSATKSTNDNWLSIACSADGTRLIASGSATYISTNFGANWARASTNTGYVASSADGTKLSIAGTYPAGSLYTSSNSGATWVSNSAPFGWNSIVSSADGSEWLGSSSHGVWIGRTTPSPRLNLELTNSSLELSWLVPSTNFVLQQNSDLTAASWITLTNAPVFNPVNLQDEVMLQQSNTGSAFFRLTAQ